MIKRIIFTQLLKAERILANRGLGRIPGVQALKRIIMDVAAPKQRIVKQVGGFKIWLNPHDLGIARELLGAGEYEKYEIELFRASVKPGMVLLDVGANIGIYSLAAAQQTCDRASIFAFEPEPSVMAMLRDNIQLNGYRSIIPIDKALADKRQVLKLNVDKANFGKHSLVVTSSADLQIEIQAMTVDEFVREHNLARVDLIKLDVEGAEGMVFAGAMHTIARFGPVIFMEYTPDWLVRAGTDTRQLFAGLERLGYRVDLIDTREHRLRRVDYAELERLRMSTKWTFQANLILSRSVSR